MRNRGFLRFPTPWRALPGLVEHFDRSKRSRFFAIAITLTPLVLFTKWFAVIHGAFTYDDFDILAVARTIPTLKSLFLVHGDVPIPLFRIFFTVMYALFDVHALYWNIYFLLLMIAVDLLALALLVSLGTNLIVSALFYLTIISASVWNYTAVGYYSMSIYPQIGLLGLVGVLAVILWRSSGRVVFMWLALAVSVAAPFIHPSGAYVLAAVGGFAVVNEFSRPDDSWPSLRMFIHDFRWLIVGLAIGAALFAVFFAVTVHGRPFLSMAHSPLSATAVLKSIYVLTSQGVALELFRPLIAVLLPWAGLETQGIAAVVFAIALGVFGFMKINASQRITYLALLMPLLAIVLVVSLGRRLSSIEDVVSSVGKYNSFAFLWFAIATFFLFGRLSTRIPFRWRKIGGFASVTIAGLLFIGYVHQGNRYRAEAALRKQQMGDLLASFKDYASETAPAPMRIPTLDGAFIFPQHELLFKYNLAHYRPFFFGFDKRLTLLRNDAMDDWSMEGIQTVSSLRQSTDPDFIRALASNRNLQDLYLRGVDLAPTPTPRLDSAPVKLDEVKVENAEIVDRTANALTLKSTGDASIILFPGAWDPEQAHILSMRASAAVDRPRRGEDPKIELMFEGQLPIPYAASTIFISNGKSDISVDLLQLYSYSLNQKVYKLRLLFPEFGSFTISDVRMSP
jgi:hypothetical protein